MMAERKVRQSCQAVTGRSASPAPARGAVGVLAAVSLMATCVSAGGAEPTAARIRQLYTHSRQRATKLKDAGKYEEAIAVAEDFLRKHPDSGMCCRGMAVVVEGILSRNLKDSKKRHEVYQRAFEEFEAAPEYYCLGASGLVRQYLWGQGEVQRDTAKAAELAQEAIDKLDDRLPRDYYLGYNLYMLRTIALRYSESGEAALEYARECVLEAPSMLVNKDFLRALFDAARSTKDRDTQLQVAKLCYVLCDFAEADINRATEMAATALTAARGPGAALQFAKSQEDSEIGSPLKDVPLFTLGDPDKLLEAAGEGNRDARINVHLATGQTAKALEEATEQMRWAAGNARYLATALKNLARCFKAHDLNLIRANRFLEYHRTGEGENPLPELERELAGDVRAEDRE